MYTAPHSNFSLLPYGRSRGLNYENTDFNSRRHHPHNLIRIVFNINAVQYQTSPIHESDNHIFAIIPGGGPDSHSDHMFKDNDCFVMKKSADFCTTKIVNVECEFYCEN